jgi:hypothetical protein
LRSEDGDEELTYNFSKEMLKLPTALKKLKKQFKILAGEGKKFDATII